MAPPSKNEPVDAIDLFVPGNGCHIDQHTRLRQGTDKILGTDNPTNPPSRKSPVLREQSVANVQVKNEVVVPL